MLIRYVTLGVVVVSGLLSNGSPGWGQRPPKLPTTGLSTDETVVVSMLKNTEPNRSDFDPTILQELEALRELSRRHEVRADDTYAELGRFIEVVTNDREAVQSLLESHPAMAGLCFGGEKTFPVLLDILISEPMDSRRFDLALWTMIYIERLDSHRVNSLLVEHAKTSVSRKDRDKLLAAAHKAEALHLKD